MILVTFILIQTKDFSWNDPRINFLRVTVSDWHHKQHMLSFPRTWGKYKTMFFRLILLKPRSDYALFLRSESTEHSIEEIRQICVSTLLPSLTGFRIIKNTTRDAGPARKLTSVDCPQYFLWGPGAAWLTKVGSSLELSVPFMRSEAPQLYTRRRRLHNVCHTGLP